MKWPKDHYNDIFYGDKEETLDITMYVRYRMAVGMWAMAMVMKDHLKIKDFPNNVAKL